MPCEFPGLFSPISIGTLRLKNRIIAAPSSQGDIENDGTLSLHNIAYYARKAKGGCALVTVGDGIVHPTGKDHPKQLLLYTDACIPSLRRCAEEIHKYNCAASVELSHGGIVCDPAFIGGQRPFGPSEMDVTIGFQTEQPVTVRSQAMTAEFMEELAVAYAEAARRVKIAGFDMIMLHAAHGWLISQFFSPHTNHRTDEYGGSAENRARFAVMVVRRIREAVGDDFPIEIRMNGRDGLEPEENGLEVEDAVAIAQILEPYVDSFHISSCMHMYPPHQDIMQSPVFVPHGHLLHLAAEIRKAVDKPVCTVGGFSDLNEMENAIASGQADMIAIGRQSLADPDIANLGRHGRQDEVRRCLRCACCQSGRFTWGTARCSVNPEIGREYEISMMPPSSTTRNVLIAGGGPSGMQAAISAAQRGHRVTLCEKSDRLGGALWFAEHIPFKEDLFHLISSMRAQLDNLPVDIRLNTAVTPELAASEEADVIIAALGARPVLPSIPGVDLPHVITAEQADLAVPSGQRIAVIGAGQTGVETALYLAGLGKDVTLLGRNPNVAPDANIRYARTYVWELNKMGIEVHRSTSCVEITDQGVHYMSPDGETFFSADCVVIAAGLQALCEEAEALRNCAQDFIAIGSCVKPGSVMYAVRSGYDAGTFGIS